MASPSRSILPCPEPTALQRQPPALTGDVLEQIFLRVASHADLARASAACVSFRRIIADPIFLRRFRSRHPPILLGFLGIQRQGFQPMEPPHPNAPAARAFGSAAGFSFDYLPRHEWLEWYPCDVCDGRVLLERRSFFEDQNDANNFAWPDLAVCDPLPRQYLLLPPIPEDLLATVEIEERDINNVYDSLVPSGDWEETLFKVLRTVQSRTGLVVLVFSSTSGCWSFGASTTWDVLSFHMPFKLLGRPQFAYGCCYYRVTYLNKLIKLDMNTMEFATVDLPPDHEGHSIAIVEAGEGKLGMFSLLSDVKVTSVDYYIFMQNLSGRANEWHAKNTIPLPDHRSYYFLPSAEGCVFLVRTPAFQIYNLSNFEYVCFSLDTKTSNIERIGLMDYTTCYPYFGFPPSLSPRRIQGYEAG